MLRGEDYRIFLNQKVIHSTVNDNEELLIIAFYIQIKCMISENSCHDSILMR